MTAKTNDVLAGVAGGNTKTLLKVIILLFIAGAAISSRLFSVIRKLPRPHDGRMLHVPALALSFEEHQRHLAVRKQSLLTRLAQGSKVSSTNVSSSLQVLTILPMIAS